MHQNERVGEFEIININNHINKQGGKMQCDSGHTLQRVAGTTEGHWHLHTLGPVCVMGQAGWPHAGGVMGLVSEAQKQNAIRENLMRIK